MLTRLPDDILRRMAQEQEEPKALQRQEISEHIAAFLAKGGKIKQIPEGQQTEAEQSFNKQDLINHHKRRTRALYDLRHRAKSE